MVSIMERPIGRPKGGQLTEAERILAKEQHKRDIAQWKADHPEEVKMYRQRYNERVRNGQIQQQKNIKMMASFLSELKNITIV